PQAVPTTTAATADSGGDTSTLAWVVVGLVIAAAIGLGIALVVRRKKNVEDIPSEERLQRLFSTVSMWTVQGWVVEREDETSAILSRDGELMRVAVRSEERRVGKEGRSRWAACRGRKKATAL